MPIKTTFTIGQLTEIQLRDPAFVRGKFDEALRAQSERDQELARVGAQAEALTAQTQNLQQALAAKDVDVQKLKETLASEASRAQNLADRLKELETATPKIGVHSLVTQFKGDIDKINREVLANRAVAGMLVDNVEVEVRGGIDVSQGLQITQLPPGQLNAVSASTIRFNLKPSAVVRIVDDE
jgi:predicted nuclease with TOPRIM domain